MALHDHRRDQYRPSGIFLECPRCSFGGWIEAFIGDGECPVCHRELTVLVAPLRLIRQELAVAATGDYKGQLGFVTDEVADRDEVLMRFYDGPDSVVTVPEEEVVEVSLQLEEFLSRAAS